MVLDSPQALQTLPHLVWPLVLALAWALGEAGRRHLHVPRVASYTLVGLVLAPTQLGWLPAPNWAADGGSGLAALAQTAAGLLLLEFGYRINLHWYRHNPWLTAGALAQALLTLAALVSVCRAAGLDAHSAWLIGALGMASSPLALLRVLHAERSAGQISDRLLHVAALSCVLGVAVFSATQGMAQAADDGALAAWGAALWRLGLAAVLGAGLGAALPLWLRWQRLGAQGPVPLVLAALLLAGVAQAAQLSAPVAALGFGLAARHHGLVLARDAQGLGLLGELSALLLFVYVGSRLDIGLAWQGLGLGLVLAGVRVATQVSVMALLARPSGVSLGKGALTGLGLAPVSACAVMLLDAGPHTVGSAHAAWAAPLAAPLMALCVIDLIGPSCTRWALQWGQELPTRDPSPPPTTPQSAQPSLYSSQPWP